MNIEFNIEGLRWFDDSPDFGEPECICSACGKMIGKDDEGPVRFFDVEKSKEIRLHYACARERSKITRTMEIVYHGEHQQAGLCRVLVDEVDREGTVLMSEILEHCVSHSPEGFRWNCGGSSPDYLAMSILKDYFHRHIKSNERVYALVSANWQKFKWDIIAKVEGDLRITQTEIEKWSGGRKIDAEFNFNKGEKDGQS